MKQRELSFDLMRCVAAVAVIAIHILAPYRHELGHIPYDQWLTAISVNGASRWAVPVFILITGALLLSDPRPFDFPYYVRRRLSKVLIPFLVWSLFYSFLSGLTANGFDVDKVKAVLLASPNQATYYHLGFFYYFIPLYFLVPFFQYLVQSEQINVLRVYVLLWLLTSALYLMGVDGLWSNQLWLYSGYLPLGYLLFNHVTPNKINVAAMSVLGVASIFLTIVMVATLSGEHGAYTVGRWLSYKTLNVISVAAMIFMLCRRYSVLMSGKVEQGVSIVSRYSLGIYLLHPIFLWPMKAFNWHQGHPAWVIPLWVVISGAGALWVSHLVARQRKLSWLLP